MNYNSDGQHLKQKMMFVSDDRFSRLRTYGPYPQKRGKNWQWYVRIHRASFGGWYVEWIHSSHPVHFQSRSKRLERSMLCYVRQWTHSLTSSLSYKRAPRTSVSFGRLSNELTRPWKEKLHHEPIDQQEHWLGWHNRRSSGCRVDRNRWIHSAGLRHTTVEYRPTSNQNWWCHQLDNHIRWLRAPEVDYDVSSTTDEIIRMNFRSNREKYKLLHFVSRLSLEFRRSCRIYSMILQLLKPEPLV